MNSVGALVPDLPESVADAIVATWHRKPGDVVVRDGMLVETETDRMVLEVSTSTDGIPDAVLEDESTTVTSHQILGYLHESNSAGKETSARSGEKASTLVQRQQASLEEQDNDTLSPAIRRLLVEHNLNASAIKSVGVGGRLTREDVERHLARASVREPAPTAAAPAAQPVLATRSERRVPMTRLRKRAAERLLGTKNPTAILATFNEINMKPIMDLRKQYGEALERRYGIRLGFVLFYVKAVVEALKRYLEVNASIDGDDVVHHNYFDVNMAVSTPRDLVMLVLCNVDTLGMADTGKKTKKLAVEDRDGKLTVEGPTDGNFTIINGGVFGSLMFMPIINPPRSAILGMHAIGDRLMAVNGQVEILSVTYLALPCDHRLIDSRESMGFLVAIKELLEDPTRLLLDVW